MSEESAKPHENSHEADHEHDHHHIKKHVRAYLIVGALLLVFTIITVALAFVDFGHENINIGVALLVAAFKAGLVAYIFMHLNSERPMIYQVLIFTVVFVIALFALTFFAYQSDIPRQF